MKYLLTPIFSLCTLATIAQDSTNVSKLKSRNELLPRVVIDVNYKRGNLLQVLDTAHVLEPFSRNVNSVIAKPKFIEGHTEGGDIQIGYFFGKQHLFGVGTGLMYLYQTGSIQLDTFHAEYASAYYNSGNNAGLKGEFRQIITSKSRITEQIKVTNINIPVLAKFKYQFSEHFGVALDAGALFNMSIKNEFSTNAVFDYEAAILTTDGKSSVYDGGVAVEGIDFLITRANFQKMNPQGNITKFFDQRYAEGYNVGLGVAAKPGKSVTNYNIGSIGFLGQAALSYQLNYRVTLNLGGYYMVQNFTPEKDPTSWMITNKVGEYNSITEGVKTSHNTSYGLNIGIRYFVGKDKDIDNDGVPDKTDKCPLQFGRKTFGGCPDSDNDGIADCDDNCPFEFGSASANGCPDKDADGIKDNDDLCPDQSGPKKFNGCPDSDNDEIPDNFDRCPNEAGSLKHLGCPDSVKLDETHVVPNPVDFFDVPPIELSSHMINFELGKYQLSPQTISLLNEVADSMVKYPKIVVFISGHTDDLGGVVDNLLLSLSRAEAVKKYLMDKGISKSNILLAGYGKQYPIVENNNDANRAKNRRIEMKLLLPVEKENK
jgi:outer membrane protein OmpA-like peptidoglycan-associated protein